MDDLFVIKNLPLYLSDSARTWLEHLEDHVWSEDWWMVASWCDE
jgi:hypothetical protein